MIKLTGTKQMIEKMAKLRTGFEREVMNALRAEALVELAEAKKRVPVDTGELRESGFVGKPEVKGNKASVLIGFAAPYAVYVHEDLEAFHKTGQAKFLESTLVESAAYMKDRIARRISLKRAGKG